jgi:hypothetical protein
VGFDELQTLEEALAGIGSGAGRDAQAASWNAAMLVTAPADTSSYFETYADNIGSHEGDAALLTAHKRGTSSPAIKRAMNKEEHDKDDSTDSENGMDGVVWKGTGKNVRRRGSVWAPPPTVDTAVPIGTVSSGAASSGVASSSMVSWVEREYRGELEAAIEQRIGGAGVAHFKPSPYVPVVSLNVLTESACMYGVPTSHTSLGSASWSPVLSSAAKEFISPKAASSTGQSPRYRTIGFDAVEEASNDERSAVDRSYTSVVGKYRTGNAGSFYSKFSIECKHFSDARVL